MSLGKEIRNERKRLALAQEEIYAKLAKGQKVVPDDYLVLDADDIRGDKLDGHVARLEAVHGFQAAAGTPAEQAEARKRAIEATNRLAIDGAKLKEEIAEREAKVAAMERDKAEKERKVNDIDKALEVLPRLCPPYFKDLHAHAMRHVRENFTDLRAAKARVDVLKKLLALDSDDKQILLYGEGLEVNLGHLPEFIHLIDVRGGSSTKAVHLPSWEKHKTTLTAELAELEAKIPALQTAHDAACKEADSCLAYYLVK